MDRNTAKNSKYTLNLLEIPISNIQKQICHHTQIMYNITMGIRKSTSQIRNQYIIRFFNQKKPLSDLAKTGLKPISRDIPNGIYCTIFVINKTNA